MQTASSATRSAVMCPPSNSNNASQNSKSSLRRICYDARNAEPHKDDASRAAIERLVALPAYSAAKCVMWYVDCRSELRTRWYLPQALASEKQIVVPYCTTEAGTPSLGLWRLASLDELVVGKWKILEPPSERRADPERVVVPQELDLVIVPAVGFTRDGLRLGNGQGYYDRMLAQVRDDCVLVGLGYECQILAQIPQDAHDVTMNWVITEKFAHASDGFNASPTQPEQ